MNWLFSIRERFGAAILSAIAAVILLSCGALLAFVLSPQQALEAWRIDRMPELSATELRAAEVGEKLLVTGRLEDNPEGDGGRFVAYRLDEWFVTPADLEDSESEPKGDWRSVEQVVPALALKVGSVTFWTLEAHDARLGGPLQEELTYSESHDQAKYDGEWLPHGSRRLRGFFNGDLVTVLGKKASTGDILPQEFYAGDRVAFVESKEEAAKGLFIGGLSMMACAPVLLVGGALKAFFGRRRRF